MMTTTSRTKTSPTGRRRENGNDNLHPHPHRTEGGNASSTHPCSRIANLKKEGTTTTAAATTVEASLATATRLKSNPQPQPQPQPQSQSQPQKKLVVVVKKQKRTKPTVIIKRGQGGQGGGGGRGGGGSGRFVSQRQQQSQPQTQRAQQPQPQQQQRQRKQQHPHAGLPSFSSISSATLAAGDGDGKKNDADGDNDNNVDGDGDDGILTDDGDGAPFLPCETLMIVQAIVRRTTTSTTTTRNAYVLDQWSKNKERLEIPCLSCVRPHPSDPKNTPTTTSSSSSTSSIYGVLESQLYPLLLDRDRPDDFVSREIQQCLHRRDAVRLQSGNGGSALSVLVLWDDYLRAADAAFRYYHADVIHQQQQRQQRQQDEGQQSQQSQIPQQRTQRIRDWFVDSYLNSSNQNTKGRNAEAGSSTPPGPVAISEAQLQRRNDLPCPVPAVLSELLRVQVILPRTTEARSGGAGGRDLYQLWLPGFALLVREWDKSVRKLLLQIKRTHTKECAITALHQPYSPVPTSLVVQHLESIGEIKLIQRPAGIFVQLN